MRGQIKKESPAGESVIMKVEYFDFFIKPRNMDMLLLCFLFRQYQIKCVFKQYAVICHQEINYGA